MIPACPDCGASLGRNAHKCRCGWVSAQSESRQHIDCFFAPHCVKPAQINTDRYQLKGNFQNLCLGCDEKLHHEKADAWCRSHGLISVQQKIDYCRSMAKKMFSGVRFVQDRVPGEDDELAA